jgi:hypothetical protein
VSLSTIRILGRHLTPDNHRTVLARACGKSRPEIEVLVAELDPQPDARAMVRRLPPYPSALKPTAAERYRVQLTIASETHDKFRKVQVLLRREIPNGDPAAIFDRAITLLLAKVEKVKCGAGAAVIRPGADTAEAQGWRAARAIPRWIRRHVWSRDGGRCAFVSRAGHRCGERHFLDYHHRMPRALGGPNTIDNISLRCRGHNQHAADLVFGPRSRSPRPERTQHAT